MYRQKGRKKLISLTLSDGNHHSSRIKKYQYVGLLITVNRILVLDDMVYLLSLVNMWM